MYSVRTDCEYSVLYHELLEMEGPKGVRPGLPSGGKEPLWQSKAAEWPQKKVQVGRFGGDPRRFARRVSEEPQRRQTRAGGA